MKKATAKKYNISGINDLIFAGRNLTFSADPEFLNRNDCYIGLQKYGIVFNSVKPCNVTNRYEFLASGEADVFVGYETDIELYKGDITRLADPDQFFPRYMAIPIVNMKTLNVITELENVLNKLSNSITTKELIISVNELNEFKMNPAVAIIFKFLTA
jgi:osmoprotectant transport system permease protein